MVVSDLARPIEQDGLLADHQVAASGRIGHGQRRGKRPLAVEAGMRPWRTAFGTMQGVELSLTGQLRSPSPPSA